MRVLCVAEKRTCPSHAASIAKTITQILSGGSFSNVRRTLTQRAGRDKYCRNYDFTYRLPRAVLGTSGAPHVTVDMTMTSVRGHMMEVDFPDEYKWGRCDAAALFTAPTLVRIAKDAQKVAHNLATEARSADLLMIWTDCDREGEQIGYEIAQHCRSVRASLRVRRARFSALLASQIHRAATSPVELDLDAAYAVEARQQIDLRAGAAFTRLQTTVLGRCLAELDGMVISYGPCQFPTLGFVVEHYKRVQAFVPEAFWALDVRHRSLEFLWERKHLFDRRAVEALHARCHAAPHAMVTQVTRRPVSKRKPTPLTTVELQKSASRLFHLAPKRVLDVAEGLYQRGLLSYPRTETDQYDKDFDFHALLSKQTSDPAWGALVRELLEVGGLAYERPRNGTKNDKAHPPIHPTAHANGLSGDEKKLYDYVTRRFLASCATDAQGHETVVRIKLGSEAFHASGTIVAAHNYLKLFTYETWKNKEMPAYEEGMHLRVSCDIKEGKTTRPNLLTEADLVALMDKNGIGTDATIAEHIRKVIDRQYVMLHKQGKTNYLVPSTLGMGLVEGYQSMEISKHLCQPMLRRDTEAKLDLIANASLSRDATVTESMQEYSRIYSKVQADFDIITQRVRGLIGMQQEQRASSAHPESTHAPERTAPTFGAAHSASDPVACHCGSAAVEKRDTSGRAYWSCADDDGCGFFHWKKQPPTPASRAPPPQPESVAPTRTAHDPPRCACDLTAKRATASSVRRP